MTSKQMEGLSELDQAKKAIRYMLDRIATSPEVGWYCGFGTQAFSILTEAHATLNGEDLERTRNYFMPDNPRDPSEKVKA